MSELNSLSESFPDIAREAHGWDPSKVSRFSSKKMEWKCPLNHIYSAAVSNRTSRKSRCPYCSGNKVLVGFNDLQTKFPEIAQEADGWDPKSVNWGSGKKLKWKCQIGHFWEASPNSRTTGKGTGCPFCSHNRVWVGFNDIATLNPILAKEAFGWNPCDYSTQSGKRLDWKCIQGHIWKAKPADRFRGDGCPYCGGKKVMPGFNDLFTTHPEIALEADGWDTSQVTMGSNKIQKWICGLGHGWSASPNSRTNMKSGCPYCSNLRVLVGFNDLSTTHPEIAVEADGWNPKQYISSGKQKMQWRCSKAGHVWKQRIGERKLGRGCPSCAVTGFDPNKKAYVYLLRNNSIEVMQIGISGALRKRLQAHARNGFEIVDIRGPMNGVLAFEIERDIIEYLDKHEIKRGSKAFASEFDGYTESWRESDFKINSIYEFMNLIDSIHT